ncbi:hypothetical protein HPB47_001841 [Ixodes persulcatus]|uniref:Uncharacterized protein n=1 Tax=Ixodes persulcatus TaxID=34615 RepID=A0AC60PN06_IXOPE|nr:hypothetical protein HPB47_001841 [Ixodes persulcatus]
MERRTQYTEAFKRIILSEKIGNSSAARRLAVSELTIQGWHKTCESIFRATPTQKAFCGSKRGRYPDLEEKLGKFVRERTGQFMLVNVEIIRLEVRELAQEAGLSHDTFKASRSRIQKSMRRTGFFSLRRRISICQKPPAKYKNKLTAFQRHAIALRRHRNYIIGQIGNADETLLFLDVPTNYIEDIHGTKEVRLGTMGNEKTRVTSMLACTADGQKLPPFLISKRKTIPKDETFRGRSRTPF